MRYILSGGGTGGHIYPALTIADKIKNMDKGCEILFVGTEQGLESDIVPKEGYLLRTIDVHGFDRQINIHNLVNVFTTIKSLWQAKQIINDFKPDIVIGTGGYVCGPVLLIASLFGIPSLIQEQNAIPGITNKILARFVTKIAVGYAESIRYFSNKEKIIVTGNPVRDEVVEAKRESALKTFGLEQGKLTLLVAGGSRGARSINEAMLEVYKHFAGRTDIQILHVTGKNEYNNIVGTLEQQGIDLVQSGNIIIKSYLYNMPQALAAADLVIFRAGAIGLAEVTARGIPSILVPYPFAAENHQEYNARVLEQQGAAIVILDKELKGSTLITHLEKFLSDPNLLKRMAQRSHAIGKPNSAKQIAELAVKMVQE